MSEQNQSAFSPVEGTKPRIQKFGVQKAPPVSITVWKNLHKFDKGTQFLLKDYKNLEQLTRFLAQKLEMLPAVRLYTPGGKPIRKLEELKTKNHYVAVKHATPFNEDTIPPLCPRPQDAEASPTAEAA